MDLLENLFNIHLQSIGDPDNPSTIQLFYKGGKAVDSTDVFKNIEYQVIQISNKIAVLRYGVLHNKKGPAYVAGNSKFYFQYGKLHRLDGPAMIDEYGSLGYALNGKWLDFDAWQKERAVMQSPVYQILNESNNE